MYNKKKKLMQQRQHGRDASFRTKPTCSGITPDGSTVPIEVALKDFKSSINQNKNISNNRGVEVIVSFKVVVSNSTRTTALHENNEKGSNILEKQWFPDLSTGRSIGDQIRYRSSNGRNKGHEKKKKDAMRRRGLCDDCVAHIDLDSGTGYSLSAGSELKFGGMEAVDGHPSHDTPSFS